MKKIITLILISIVAFSINKTTIKAQAVESMSLSELDPYMSSYLQPFAKAMAVSMSGGWSHTAKVHSTLGFDITFSTAVAMVPEGDFNFNPQSLNMPNYEFSKSTTPTISADNAVLPADLTRSFNTAGAPDLSMPSFNGQGISFGGMFALQGAIGLPKGTELIVRFVPDISNITNNMIPGDDIGLEETGMWGIGVKHDIKQWIPVVQKVPFLQISGLFTYSKFHTGFVGESFKITPEDFGAASTLPATTWDNQHFSIKMSSLTGSLLVGANIPIFQPYIGIGFNSVSFDGGLRGKYPLVDLVVDINNPAAFDYEVNESETDPINIEAKETSFNFQAGARLKLGFFVLHYTYTIQNYSMHSGGIAFTFR